ncbi:unnamed protein product [Musa textilis]
MAGSNRDPHELMKLFHTQETNFYIRLVRHLAQNPERMKQAIALWLWFESIGHHDFIERVSSIEGDDVILGFVSEAEACLGRLMGHHEQTRGDELPLTSSLMAKKMDLRFFESHRDEAIEGVMHIFQTVCQIIFNDVPMERAAENAKPPEQLLPARQRAAQYQATDEAEKRPRGGRSFDLGRGHEPPAVFHCPVAAARHAEPDGQAVDAGDLSVVGGPAILVHHLLHGATHLQGGNQAVLQRAIRALCRGRVNREGAAGAAADVRAVDLHGCFHGS